MAPLMNIDQLAEHLGVSADWVRLRVKRQEIPFTRLPDGKDGKLVRFTPEQVRQILDAGATPAINGPLAGRRLTVVPELGHPPAGPATPPPPPRPRHQERVA